MPIPGKTLKILLEGVGDVQHICHPSAWIDACVLYTYVAALMNTRAWAPVCKTTEHCSTCKKVVTCILEYIHARPVPSGQIMLPFPMVHKYKLESYTKPPVTTHDTTWCLHHPHAACSMHSHHKNAHEAWHGPSKMPTNTNTPSKTQHHAILNTKTFDELQDAADPGPVERILAYMLMQTFITVRFSVCLLCQTPWTGQEDKCNEGNCMKCGKGSLFPWTCQKCKKN